MSRKRILAVASGGGHWVQLRRISSAFDGCDVAFVTVHEEYRSTVPRLARFYCVRDATRWDRWALLVMVVQLFWILLRERPRVVVSTGAAPGFMALRMGRLMGARTIWIDSIANVETLSLSGLRIGPHADLWLTQWEHLAKESGPAFRGKTL